MTETAAQILTVGHSNHPIDVFLDLCKRCGVTTIADVRSVPYSKYAPQFMRVPLCDALKDWGLKYVFLGRELGARSADPACYVNGKVQYERVARTDLFQEGLDRLVHGTAIERIAIMCAEKDPLDCHRSLLVARALVGRGLLVDHILADGSLESYEDSMLRLLDKTGQPPPDLFMTLEERIGNALRDQEARIAHVDKSLSRTPDTAAS
jgi:uncharacterized protein (DUF488 family)